jgi:PAS domain-containing protein
MYILSAIFLFFFSSGYVLFLDYLLQSHRELQKVLIAPLLIFLILFLRFFNNPWKLVTYKPNKLLLLFCVTIFIELLILSTGGLQSPFLILLHLTMITISFFFTFTISLAFLLITLTTIFLDLNFYQNIDILLLTNPSGIILQLVSFLTIIPVAYLVSQQYHAKDFLTNLLQQKVATDEAIISAIKEIIIVTDNNLHIISVNDAATKMLQRSRAELIDKPIFDVLLIKDASNHLITPKKIFTNKEIKHFTKQLLENCTLMQGSHSQSTVVLQIQPIQQPHQSPMQISFILSSPNNETTSMDTLDEARTRYEALTQSIRKKLSSQKLQDIQTDLLFLEKIENDTYTVQTLPTILKQKNLAKIDLAKLCQQIVAQNQGFSKALHVQTNCVLKNFSFKDISNLTVKNYPVRPTQLTGPFFTVSCDVQKIELLIKKLFDLIILLTANTKNAQVTLSVQHDKQKVTIQIISNCEIPKREIETNLFIPYYGKLAKQTALHMGSGLEGYLSKKIMNSLVIKIKIVANKAPNQTVISLTLQK